MERRRVCGAAMPSPLPSYIRAYRKRLQLSQRELAFLLGLSSQSVISQHEILLRVPQAKALLKYEILFGKTVGELFPKLREEAEDELAVQVKALMNHLDGREDLSVAHKLELLNRLAQRFGTVRL